MPTAYGTETVGLRLSVYFRTSSMISRYVNTSRDAQQLDTCSATPHTFRTAGFDCLTIACFTRLNLSSTKDFDSTSQVVHKYRLELAGTATKDRHCR